MNISKIGNIDATPYQPQVLTKGESKNITAKNDNKITQTSNNANWQKDILLSALDNLENKIQSANNHPLDYVSNAPIETHDEALIELSFIKERIFKEQAYDSQANINPEQVLSLFLEVPELISR